MYDLDVPTGSRNEPDDSAGGVPPAAGSTDQRFIPRADVPVTDLGLGVRSCNCLKQAGITTVVGLMTWTSDELLGLSNFGVTSLQDVEAGLSRFGLYLGAAPDELEAAIDEARLRQTVDLLCRVAAEGVADNPALTLGELFGAIAHDGTSGRLTAAAADQLRRTPAAVIARDLVASYRWQDTILDAYDRLEERTKSICDDLVPGANYPRRTLAEVAGEWQITRERVRQVNEIGRERLDSSPVITRAATRLAALLDPVCSENELLAAGFDRADRSTRLLAAVCVRQGLLPQRANFDTVEVNGARWVSSGAPLDPSSYVNDVLEAHPYRCVPRATVEASVAKRLAGRAAPAEVTAVVEGTLSDISRYRVMDDVVVDWRGSYLNKMQRVLYVANEPVSKDALVAAVDGPERSVINQLWSQEGRKAIVRTVTGDFALPEWDWVERYTQCIDLMKQIIAAHDGGRISLRRLVREVTAASAFSPNSVSIYASMRPEFITENDTVRLRRPDEPVPVECPEADDCLFRIVTGPQRGYWSWAHTIDYDRMRAASTNAPRPLVEILGLCHEIDAVVEVNDTTITVRWVGNDVRVHTSTGFKAFCRSLGAADGDQVVMAFPGGQYAQAQLRPAPPDGAASADQLLHRIGTTSVETLLEDLAFSVGLDGTIDVDFTVDDLIARLHERRDGRLIDLLLAVHPELAD